MQDSLQKSSQTDKGTVRASEVLSFQYAELQKRDNGKNKISQVGIFSVLYFPEYNRYIVYLGDWSYALLRRVPVVAACQTSSDRRCYVFPAYTGNYVVKLSRILNPESITNLETILKKNSLFSYEWEKPKEREPSPSDTLIEFEEHGDSYKEKGIGKLRAKEKMKKGFKKIKSRFTSHYSFDRGCNVNSMQIKDYSELQSSDVDPTHTHNLGRKDIEAIIVRSKDIAKSRGYSSVNVEESPKDKEKTPVHVQTQTQTQTQEHMLMGVEIKETVVTRSETETFKLKQAELIGEIENERRLQDIGGEHQESQKERELDHVGIIEGERELQSSVTTQQQEYAILQTKKIEQQKEQIERSLLSEVQRQEDSLFVQEKLRCEQVKAISKKKKQLELELDVKFAQFLQKEDLTQTERAELAQKEAELASITKLREAELLALIQTQNLIREQAERREIELKKKSRLTQKECFELGRIKRDLAQEKGLEVQEQRNLEIRRSELLREAENREVKILERERLTEAERIELEANEKKLEAEHEKRLGELTLKERLTEQERLELQKREKESLQLREMKEIEKLIRSQKMMKELFGMDLGFEKREFQTEEKTQDTCQAATNILKSDLKIGDIDVAHRP